ncbi:hypothetical protein, partial [Oceanobacter sp. 1_MG-2023]|uniref:hypothetical protein n=1 Tax=Oceanobacter sp. 1_MG-2023 TaxID=3062618 RepID=UPI002733C385
MRHERARIPPDWLVSQQYLAPLPRRLFSTLVFPAFSFINRPNPSLLTHRGHLFNPVLTLGYRMVSNHEADLQA